MRVVLFIIILLCLVQGGSADAAAVSIMHQIYAALYYMMALIAFCTMALMGPIQGFCCNWDWRGGKKDKDKPHGPKHHHEHRHERKPGEEEFADDIEEEEELSEERKAPHELRQRDSNGPAKIRIRK